jgi:hypothetical protein
MKDLYHYVGGDLAASITGDLQAVDGATKGQQRVLRRLLTNPGEYAFHPEYGAGLGQKVGAVADLAGITALIRGQVLLEDAVAKVPPPEIAVTTIPNGIAVNIKYTDAVTKSTQVLSFDVNR